MILSIELAQLTMNERRLESDRRRLASLMHRIADCCKPSTLRMRLAGAIRAAGDVCCPADDERLMRAIRGANTF